MCGLDSFERNLNPNIVSAIKEWSNHTELSKLLSTLQSTHNWERFLDHYAEAMVAYYLRKQRCEIHVEFQTVNNKTADFRVSKDNDTFFVHIKRSNFDVETAKDLKISTRLDCLRKIRRPVIVSLKFHKSPTDEEMQHLCKNAKSFVEKAKEGERKEIITLSGETLCDCEIGPSHNGQNVQLLLTTNPKDGGDDPRIYKQLGDAYKQFMPEALNIILLTSAWGDGGGIYDLEDAIDDFWFDINHPCSNIVGWFKFDHRGNSIDFKLFLRENYEMPPYISNVFGSNYQVKTK